MFVGRSCQRRQTRGRSSCSQSHRTLTHAHIHRVAIGGRYIQRRHSRSRNSATSYRDRRTRFPAPPTSRPPSLPTRHTISPAAPTSSAANLEDSIPFPPLVWSRPSRLSAFAERLPSVGADSLSSLADAAPSAAYLALSMSARLPPHRWPTPSASHPC